MNNQDFDKALFQATFSNYFNEIFQKQMQTMKYEMDLIRKVEGKADNIPEHVKIIKYCRKSIYYTDNILKDVRQYFYDLKIKQLYTVIETVFRIMVYNIKKLSQCYLKRFQALNNVSKADENNKQVNDQKNKNQIQQSNKLQCICTSLQNQKNQKYRRLQHLNYQIQGIQQQEQQLTNRMNLIMSGIEQQRKKIQKINSNANRQIYEEIQKVFHQISQKSESYFNNFFRGNIMEQFQSQYLDAEHLQNQLFEGLKNQLKKLAKTKIKKVIQNLTEIFQKKQQQNQSILQKQIIKKRKTKTTTKNLYKSQKTAKKLQTRSKNLIEKNNDSNEQVSVERQRKVSQRFSTQKQSLFKQNLQLKQKIRSSANQLQKIKQILKKQQSEKNLLIYENQSMQNLFRQRTIQLQSSKAQLQWNLLKSTRSTTVSRFRKSESSKNNYNMLMNRKSHAQIPQTLDKNTQADLVNDPLIQNILNLPEQPYHQHKSFLVARTKMRKLPSEVQEKNKQKKKLEQVEKFFKCTMQKFSQALHKKQKITPVQRQHVQALFKQQKYEQISQLINKKLKQMENKIQIQQPLVVDSAKKKDNKKNKVNKNSNINIKKIQTKHCGIQTQQNRNIHSQKKNFSLNINKMKQQYSRRNSNAQFFSSRNSNLSQMKTNRTVRKSTFMNNTPSKTNIIRQSVQQHQRIPKLKMFDDSRSNRESQKQNIQSNLKKLSLQNILFQQLNFDKNLMDSPMKRSLNQRNLNSKQNQRKYSNFYPSQGFKKYSSINMNCIKRQDEYGTFDKIIAEQEQQNLRLNLHHQKSNLESERRQSQQNSIQNTKSIQKFKQNSAKFPQKYQQLIIDLLIKAGQQISLKKVNEAIQKFKLCCLTTRPASIYQHQNT